MVNFTKEELLNIAKLSALELDNKEIELFEKQIKAILDYADQLQQVPKSEEVETFHNVNILRDDVVKKCDSTDILAQAPQNEDGYFVVPKILD